MQTTTFTQGFAAQYGRYLAAWSNEDVMAEVEELEDRLTRDGELRDRDQVALQMAKAELATR